MKKLYFVRHGESEMNAQGKTAGSTESPLTKLGHQQAKMAAKEAQKLNIDYIVSSPQSRAYDTAKIIAKEIGYPVKEIHINNLFAERHYGEMEGKTWDPDLNVDGISDIETLDTVLERARLALDFLHTLDAKNILVASHGGFGRALRSHINGLLYTPYHQTPEDQRIANAVILTWI